MLDNIDTERYSVLAQKYIKLTARNQGNIPDKVHSRIQMVEGLNGRPYNRETPEQ